MAITFELDLRGTTEKDIERDSVPPGKFHVVVTNVEEGPADQTACLVFKLEVVTGTTDAVGAVMSERLFMTEKTKKRVALFARRLGLVGTSDFGKQVAVDWSQAIGKQAVVEVTEEEYEKKDGSKGKASRVTFSGIWETDDERVKDVPKDLKAATQLCEAIQATTRGSAATTPAQDDFSDL
jgi:hypothetical protein